jgi:hypothetical protein
LISAKKYEKDVRKLNGNGDFRSDECIELLKQADIVVTNPPFSLFREYVKVLMDNNKDFVILGNMNAITYKEVFPYIKENRIGLGFLMETKLSSPSRIITKIINIFGIQLCRLPNIMRNLYCSESTLQKNIRSTTIMMPLMWTNV